MSFSFLSVDRNGKSNVTFGVPGNTTSIILGSRKFYKFRLPTSIAWLLVQTVCLLCELCIVLIYFQLMVTDLFALRDRQLPRSALARNMPPTSIAY